MSNESVQKMRVYLVVDAEVNERTSIVSLLSNENIPSMLVIVVAVS